MIPTAFGVGKQKLVSSYDDEEFKRIPVALTSEAKVYAYPL